jgi:hypothetical protein
MTNENGDETESVAPKCIQSGDIIRDAGGQWVRVKSVETLTVVVRPTTHDGRAEERTDYHFYGLVGTQPILVTADLVERRPR